MVIPYRIKKEPTPYAVGTAKMPSWLFEQVETFRHESGILTRSSAINTLVAIGLYDRGYITAEDLQDLLYSEGINSRAVERVKI